MRAGATDALLEAQLHAAILKKPLDGWEAAAGSLNYQSEHQSMATIGG
jgi:cyclic pyranopterin phosphate synthase